jgi:hypothetical protein
MEKIKAIYVTNDKSWFLTKKYNGSWHPIVMDTTDDLDYSIFVYESWYEFIDIMEEGNENTSDELTNEQVKEYFTEFIDHMEGWGWEVKVLENNLFVSI